MLFAFDVCDGVAGVVVCFLFLMCLMLVLLLFVFFAFDAVDGVGVVAVCLLRLMCLTRVLLLLFVFCV